MEKDTNGQCCSCQGMGWLIYDDVVIACKEHFCGQLHPYTRSLLLDDTRTLKDEERKSVLRWKISQKKKELQRVQSEIEGLEIELFNSAPTMKMGRPIFDKLILDVKEPP